MTDDPLTHAGITTEGPNQIGTIKFVHASTHDGVVTDQSMNIEGTYKSLGEPYNSSLRSNWKACVKCASGETCPATDVCKVGTKPNPSCTKEQWDSVGKYAGQLFVGYGTIRNMGE